MDLLDLLNLQHYIYFIFCINYLFTINNLYLGSTKDPSLSVDRLDEWLAGTLVAELYKCAE